MDEDSGGCTVMTGTDANGCMADILSDPCSVVEEDNLQEQQDEVLALQSIYEGSDEERISVLSEPDESGHGLFHIQIKIPVVSPSGGCQVDLLIPLSGGESPSQQTGKNENPVEGGNIQPTADAAEGGAKELEEGAKAMTPPPDYGRDVTFQRSLSGQRWSGSFHVQYLCPLTLSVTFPPGYPLQAPPVFALSSVWLLPPQLTALCKQLDQLWEANPNMPIVFSWVDWLENETFNCLGLSDSLVLMAGSGDVECEDVDDRAESDCWDIGHAVHSMLQYSNQKEAVEFCKSTQECCLCFDEKLGARFFRLEPCKHHFCFDCISTHCNLHVTDGTVQLLSCPDSECKVMISPDILQIVLSPENFIRWETLSLQRSLDEMGDIVYCPRCQAVVIREQDAALNLAYCLICCYSFCTECDQPWHQGSECMSEVQRLDARAGRIQERDQQARARFERLRREAEEKAKSVSVIKAKTRICPNCKIPIEKIEGCNKMTCRCGSAFCWLCGKAIDGYNHFTKTSCSLFNYNPVEVAQRVVPQRRPPDALLWMQAQVEMLENPRQRQMRCVQCKQTNYKLDNNNHIHCWNCKSHLCFHCRSRITGVVTKHFVPGGCPQHS